MGTRSTEKTGQNNSYEYEKDDQLSRKKAHEVQKLMLAT